MDNTRLEGTEKILDRVRKLFSLAGNNPSEEEATAAALKAQELISRYNLTVTDDSEKIELSTTAFMAGANKSWKYGLANVIAKNFRVKCYWIAQRQIVFYGYKQDTMVATEVFKFLFESCEKLSQRECSRVYKKTGSYKGTYFSYSRGFIAGVKEKLDSQCIALMIVMPKEVETGYEKVHEELGLKPIVKGLSNVGNTNFSKDSYHKGVQDGKHAMSSRELKG